MTGADKVVCQAATLLLLFTLTAVPARAQFGGGDMMTQMAPMLEMMKAGMGKRRFAMVMQTVGPMASGMMQNGGGGLSGMMGGSGGYGGMLTSAGGQMISMAPQMMSVAPQLMRISNLVGGHRRHRRR